MTPTTTPTVRPGVTVALATDDRRLGRVVTSPTAEGLIPSVDGMFVINTGTSESPYFTFALLTGRTRRMWGMDCPTIERFIVETVVREGDDGSFAIWGVPGDRIAGTFVCRPEYVV